jgi:hypothetical protein
MRLSFRTGGVLDFEERFHGGCIQVWTFWRQNPAPVAA